VSHERPPVDFTDRTARQHSMKSAGSPTRNSKWSSTLHSNRLYRDQASPIINEHIKLTSSCGYMLQSIVHSMAKECVQHAKGAI
jgi:hypothetical protein